MHGLHPGVARQELRERARILTMAADAVRERADSAHDQPAVESGRDGASLDLDVADALEELAVLFGNDGAAQDIAGRLNPR
jgi:hypothetical protein